LPISHTLARHWNNSGFGLWKSLSPVSKRLIATGVALMLGVVVAVTMALWDTRASALDDAAHTANGLGIAIAEQTDRSFQSVALVLQGTQKDIETAGITTPAGFRAALQTKATFDSLVDQNKGLPQANAFTIIGADGQLINYSRRWPIPPTDLSDRDYFKFLRDNDDTHPMISGPVQNRGDGTWTVYVIRRVDGPHGVFLGLLLGAIDLDYFNQFYKAVANDDGMNILLLKSDGSILGSFPPTGQIGQQFIPPSSEWHRIVATGHPGTYAADGLITAGPRLISVHPLADYPLVVDVSLAESTALANWRGEATLAAAGTLAAMLIFVLLLRALSLQLQRLEQSKKTLAEQNAALIRVEAQIRYLAHHDDLTKLVNRRNFRRLLEGAIERASRDGRGVGVLYLDLDRFKQVNDTRGHGIGDRLLIQVAARLRGAMRATDILARTGGDEFAIIQPMIDNASSPVRLAEILLQQIAKPFEIEGPPCRISVSIGIASYPEQAANAGELLRNADTALYRAKADGRGLFCVFDETMDLRQQQLFALEQELRQALEFNQFELDYQPIVESGSRRVVCCEALIRWRHPERGLVSPFDFIAIAENLGLMGAIGYWVFETACRDAMTWPESVNIAVNLSPVQFNDEHLASKLTEILLRTKLRPGRLFLEVTEGLLLEETSSVLGIMHRLRKLGIRFSLDDFGTGHAGLGYLRQFPFDGIKIDKFFIQDMVEQPQAHAIVAALLSVSAALDLDVIAEGVETEEQFAALRALNCKHIQGYLTGRPRPAAAIRRLLLDPQPAASSFSTSPAR
jgi:diguanylate cyclase (GGDEF)-like protein